MQTRTARPSEHSSAQQASSSTQLKEHNVVALSDSRTSHAAQRRTQNLADASGVSTQLRMIQAKMQSKGEVAQRVEEEEPLQGKFETAQRIEEEEPLQGKFETAQRVEEEELLQGKFETAQRVEEEEPLQGKFETAQRVEEEEVLQGKFETVQRVEEEEPLQGKFETAQRVEEEEPLQGKFEAAQRKEEAKPNNTGLPNQLKAGIESLSGMSMDHVNVHYNSDKPAQLNAHAYAQGSDIHVAPGQEQHLPHEAWHVAQQAQGRVKPTMQMKMGVPVNDDVGLETEADVMGAKAMSIVQQHRSVKMSSSGPESAPVFQGKLFQSPRVPKKAGWNPNSHKWPGSKGAGASGDFWEGVAVVRGSDVNGSAAKMCDDVTDLVGSLSGGQAMGHPHMAPQRMGGKGDTNNVRPWAQTFEDSDWHGTLDNQIKSHFISLKDNTDLYEDVTTTDTHTHTDAWIKPLKDKHDTSADNPDKVKLKSYLDTIEPILHQVPDGAKVTASGADFVAAGTTFAPPDIDMVKAKTALNTFNGGNLDNVKPA